MYKKIKTSIKNYLLQQKLKKNIGPIDLSIINTKAKTILIIDCIVPEYNKDSGSRRLYEIIKLLLKNGMHVFLLADLKEYKYKSDYIEAYQKLGVIVYQPYLDDRNVLFTKERFIKKIAPQLQYAWLHRPDIFKKYYNVIKNGNSSCECIFDMVDFHYLRLIREYKLNENESLKKEANKHLEIELDNCKKADTIIAISEEDKLALLKYYKDEHKIKVISNVHQFIEKQDDFLQFKDRKQLLFVGSFKHLPNVDALNYLKNEIMPLVWKEIPEVEVIIIGSYPSPDILDLSTDNFIIKGFVDDISTYFKQAKLFIAPLRFGAGIKGKIGQSLEYSLPLVTTDIGAEGFNFMPFENEMIANTSDSFAKNIVELYTDEALWDNISNHAGEILKPFSLKTTNTIIKKALKL